MPFAIQARFQELKQLFFLLHRQCIRSRFDFSQCAHNGRKLALARPLNEENARAIGKVFAEGAEHTGSWESMNQRGDDVFDDAFRQGTLVCAGVVFRNTA